MTQRVRIKPSAAGGSYFASPDKHVACVPTGCQNLDLALGGGWAESRIANLVGDKSTGKTLLCIEAVVNFLKKYPNGKVRYRECESAFDNAYAEALGMPVNRVDFGGGEYDTIEDIFEDMERVIEKARGPELYIVDSLDALSDRAEMARKIDEPSFAANKAKQLSALFRRLVRKLGKKNVTVLIVSQVRDKIGVTFGDRTSRSGGKALDFYASQIVYLSQVGMVDKTKSGIKRTVGVRIKAKVKKNKVGMAHRTAEFQILFGYGIDDHLAGLEFLRSVKALTDLDLKNTENDAKLARLAEQWSGDKAQTARLRTAVRKRWIETENLFLPTRKKY